MRRILVLWCALVACGGSSQKPPAEPQEESDPAMDRECSQPQPPDQRLEAAKALEKQQQTQLAASLQANLEQCEEWKRRISEQADFYNQRCTGDRPNGCPTDELCRWARGKCNDLAKQIEETTSSTRTICLTAVRTKLRFDMLVMESEASYRRAEQENSASNQARLDRCSKRKAERAAAARVEPSETQGSSTLQVIGTILKGLGGGSQSSRASVSCTRSGNYVRCSDGTTCNVLGDTVSCQ